MRLTETDRPLANAMWDFSWLERRYPGGGYADWDRALDGLVERGYELVRIDAYPHMIATDPERTWRVDGDPYFPWGTPGPTTIDPAPALVEFVRRCAERDLYVGLTTWFRAADRYEETTVETPQEWGEVWTDTLAQLEDADLLDAVAFVDLENEFGAGADWITGDVDTARHTDSGKRWMNESIAAVRDSYPQQDYTISFSYEWDSWADQDVSALDFLELHLFMDHGGGSFSDFIDLLGHDRPWEFDYLDALADRGERLYRMNPERWRDHVRDAVAFGVEWSEAAEKPLVTTEAWGPPRAADWPEFDWSWLKDLDDTGVRSAAESGRWLSMCTSNHCGPQFRGMWDDVDWHRELTETIRSAEIDI